MLRRIVIGLAITALVATLVAVIVVRQLVFGGTPTIHRTGSQATPTACATSGTTNTLRAYAINSQQSSASYEAHFQVAGQPVPGTVTGITGDVSGQFLLVSTPQPTIQFVKIVVDLRTLDSGSADRDQHVRNDTLETDRYPFATFTTRDARVLSGSYSEGQPITFRLTGDLTLHGVTQSATFAMQGKATEAAVTGSGTTIIHLQDYHMRPPMTTSVVPVSVNTGVLLMISFVAQREACAGSF